jgi:hypothetical protein
MPTMGIRQEFELQTRDRYTKVTCEVGIKINGRELPNAEAVGGGLEKMIVMLQEHVTQYYTKVPERVETPRVGSNAPQVAEVKVVEPTPAKPANDGTGDGAAPTTPAVTPAPVAPVRDSSVMRPINPITGR